MKEMRKPVKILKKAFYVERIDKFKRTIAWMLIGGFAFSFWYLSVLGYTQYASSKANIVLSYSEIANSRYPDGSRFTYYDLTNEEYLKEALEIMQKKGKYLTYTVEDLRNAFSVSSSLDSSASSGVSALRNAGNDFSYVANEYKIKFIQPHDYKNKNFFQRIFTPDYSDEFLKILSEINRKHLAYAKGGADGFKTVSELGDMSGYDYDEKINVYKSRINAITKYLRNLEKTSARFQSKKYDMSIKDVMGRYELLITNKLNSISNLVNASGISKNPEIVSNKLRINIENTNLTYSKTSDKTIVNEYAMKNYDQTFTENLINVIQDESKGLYQARPKTYFDTVVSQMNTFKEEKAEDEEVLYNLAQDLIKYTNFEQSPEERARLIEKCEALFNDVDKDYNELTKVAREVVSETLGEANKGYMAYEVEKTSIFSLTLLIKLGILFVSGAMSMFVIYIFYTILKDRFEVERKLNMLKKIKLTEKGA